MIELSPIRKGSGPHSVARILNQYQGGLNKAACIRYPMLFEENLKPLENSYLESLITKNVIEKNHNAFRAKSIAKEIRALINSLSETHKKKFVEIVQAFEKDKEMIKGAIISGGEIRVIAECGPAIVINTLAELLGITYNLDNQTPTFHSFSGASAGSFAAAGMAFRSLNSSIFRTCAETEFIKFYRSPETLENWANRFLRRGYHHATGKYLDLVRVEHMHELGSNLEVLVGQWGPKLLSLPETYLLPRELESRFGLNPNHTEIKKLIRATANLPILFYPLRDIFNSCGDCYIESTDGKRTHLFDAGIFQKFLLPLHLQLEEIQKYKENKVEKPGLYFVIGNKKARERKMPKTLFGKPTPKYMFHLYSTGVYISDLVDKYIVGLPTAQLKKAGADRTYIEASCEANDPFTGKVTKLGLGAFESTSYDRETIMCANIPTSNFQELTFESTIDQLHRKFVDPLYISSNGTCGKSAYELFLSDVNKASGKIPEQSSDTHKKLWALKTSVTTQVARS